MRIGFLFNHDQIHQVAHGLPIALELAKLGTGHEIIICSANKRITQEVRAIGGEALAGLKIVELGLAKRSSHLLEIVAGGLIPASKLLLYRDNLDFFRSLDVLVVPEKTSLLLKDRFGLDELKIVHVRHGAGDRAIGFDKASARFDHVLASGPKIRDRLIAEAGVSPERITVVGYPKFDLFAQGRVRPSPATGRPVVVYNPHVAPHLSSWYRCGQAILNWFADHPEYELIFAPHIMLFERRVAVTIQPPRLGFPGSISPKIRNARNILVDTNSRALTTMDYLNRADIYLGDASSQVYEFLFEPRPCVFFNAHGFDWMSDKNFAHWHLGSVIDDVARLGGALSDADAEHRSIYQPLQQEMRRYTFEFADTPASVRGARAIMEVAASAAVAARKTRRGSRRGGPVGQPAPVLAPAPVQS